jgi:hypothetical protein
MNKEGRKPESLTDEVKEPETPSSDLLQDNINRFDSQNSKRKKKKKRKEHKGE